MLSIMDTVEINMKTIMTKIKYRVFLTVYIINTLYYIWVIIVLIFISAVSMILDLIIFTFR